MTEDDLIDRLKCRRVIDIYGNHFYFNSENYLHREYGPATEYTNGTKYWCINGKVHRIGGPAIEHADGSRMWAIDGRYHREDGPAIEHADGDKEWWLNGVQISEEEFLERTKK